MSALAEQHTRWSEARGRLWNVEPPKAAPAKPAVTKKVLSPQTIAIRESRARFNAAMREALNQGLAATVGARFLTDDEELSEFLKTALPDWRRIATEVADKHGVLLVDLISHRRDAKSCRARHEAWWRIKRETTLSLPQIGRKFGGRDHTTVIAGIRRHEMRMANGKV